MSGAVQVSERQQARRENWRLIRRRPGFIIGVFIVLVWTVCAVFGDRITPHNPLDFRDRHAPLAAGQVPVRHRRTGPRRAVACDGRRPRRPEGGTAGGAARCVLRRDPRHDHGVLRRLARHRAGPHRRGVSRPAGGAPRLAGGHHARDSRLSSSASSRCCSPRSLLARCDRRCIAERDLDYVTSAKLRGESSLFMMFREILPNVSGPIIVELTVRIGYAVFTVATLSFLGRRSAATVARLGRTGQRGASATSAPASGGRRSSRRWRSPASSSQST